MKFCSHCGKEIADEAVVCVGCGCSTESVKKQETPSSVKYCGYCGKELNTNAVVCTNCGCAVSDSMSVKSKSSSQNKTLYNIAKIFMFITIGAYALCFVSLLIANFLPNALYYVAFSRPILVSYTISSIIPLAWIIPMTVVFCRKVSNGERIGMGFKICSLLFVNIISGILMLCASEEN